METSSFVRLYARVCVDHLIRTHQAINVPGLMCFFAGEDITTFSRSRWPWKYPQNHKFECRELSVASLLHSIHEAISRVSLSCCFFGPSRREHRGFIRRASHVSAGSGVATNTSICLNSRMLSAVRSVLTAAQRAETPACDESPPTCRVAPRRAARISPRGASPHLVYHQMPPIRAEIDSVAKGERRKATREERCNFVLRVNS